jgi:hypothetical protein
MHQKRGWGDGRSGSGGGVAVGRFVALGLPLSARPVLALSGDWGLGQSSY